MERVAACLAQEFATRGWAVRTVFAVGDESLHLLAWCHDQGVEAETNPAVLQVTDPHGYRDLLALRRLVRSSAPTVAHLHYGSSFISVRDVIAVRLAGIRRCIVTTHHPEPWSHTGSRKRLLTRLASYLCTTVVVPSQAVGGILLEAGVPAQKIRVIWNGLQPPVASASRAESRSAFGLPQDAFVVGTLARLEPHKGIADLIEAVAHIPDSQGSLRLVVAGEGSQRQALEQLAISRLGDRALFPGHVRDTQPLYAASDVFALPSYLEGFGLAYVEAAFHGIPSIGCRVGGVPEAILDGQTGFLVPPGDQEALADALVRLRDDPALRAQLGSAAMARAFAEFTQGHMADEHERVYRVHQPTAGRTQGSGRPASDTNDVFNLLPTMPLREKQMSVG
jgi:glycosyltransferase involved in cell wall biosynthesis